MKIAIFRKNGLNKPKLWTCVHQYISNNWLHFQRDGIHLSCVRSEVSSMPCSVSAELSNKVETWKLMQVCLVDVEEIMCPGPPETTLDNLWTLTDALPQCLEALIAAHNGLTLFWNLMAIDLTPFCNYNYMCTLMYLSLVWISFLGITLFTNSVVYNVIYKKIIWKEKVQNYSLITNYHPALYILKWILHQSSACVVVCRPTVYRLQYRKVATWVVKTSHPIPLSDPSTCNMLLHPLSITFCHLITSANSMSKPSWSLPIPARDPASKPTPYTRTLTLSPNSSILSKPKSLASSNLIYHRTCTQCDVFYARETRNSLSARMNGHQSSTKSPDNLPFWSPFTPNPF